MTTEWSGRNRRKFPRASYPCLVVIRNQGKDNNDIILTHTENIGIGGVCFTLKQSMKMFSQVDLELDLLDMENHIKCRGKVVWNIQRGVSSPKKPLFFDVGVEFVGISDDEKKRLERVVERLVPE